jgi:arylsulfatase A-like enzyme
MVRQARVIRIRPQAAPCMRFIPRDFSMKFSSIALLFVLATIATAAGKPNILFILADDLGKEWISCYGAEDIRTPNIDALADGGMKFHNAWSMPQCTPSRVALLTGTYPWRNGWVNHWDVPRWGVGYFDAKQKRNTTFARLMKESGYATTAAGKWQINDFRIEPQAMKGHGFDDWLMWTGYETGNPPSANRYADPYVNTPQGSTTREGRFGPDLYTDHLIAFMKANKEAPMLLYHSMCLPHTPLVATPDDPDAKTSLEKHKAMVRYTDKQVGRLVSAIDELGLRERTIIFFTTDNGSTTSITGTRNGRKVKGAKGKTSEAGVGAPFIVNAPGRVPAKVETDALTDFTDLFPTFVDLAGGKVPDDLEVDGVSLAPLLLGTAKDSGRDWIMALGHGPARIDGKGIRGVHDFFGRVIRDQRFKVWVDTAKKITRLHDLKDDPWEERNLLDDGLSEEQEAALRKFQTVVDSLPDKDARPLYEPRAANPWDATAASAGKRAE